MADSSRYGIKNDSVSSTAPPGDTPSSSGRWGHQAITDAAGTVNPLLATAERSARLNEVGSRSSRAAFRDVAVSGNNTVAATIIPTERTARLLAQHNRNDEA